MERKAVSTAPGQILRDYRASAGLEVDQLAEAVGVSGETITRLEAGERMDDFAANALAAYFGVTPEEMKTRYVDLTPQEEAARVAEIAAHTSPEAVATRALANTARELKHSRAIRAIARHLQSTGVDLKVVLDPEDLAALKAAAEILEEPPL